MRIRFVLVLGVILVCFPLEGEFLESSGNVDPTEPNKISEDGQFEPNEETEVEGACQTSEILTPKQNIRCMGKALSALLSHFERFLDDEREEDSAGSGTVAPEVDTGKDAPFDKRQGTQTTEEILKVLLEVLRNTQKEIEELRLERSLLLFYLMSRNEVNCEKPASPTLQFPPQSSEEENQEALPKVPLPKMCTPSNSGGSHPTQKIQRRNYYQENDNQWRKHAKEDFRPTNSEAL